MNKNNIINYLSNHKADFNKKYSIHTLALFGSFARDKNVEDSDIDIVYETSTKGLTFMQSFELEEELFKAFGKEIDLVNFKYMNPLIKRKAIKDMIYV